MGFAVVGDDGAWQSARRAARSFGAARRRAMSARWSRRLGHLMSGLEGCCERCCESLSCLGNRERFRVSGRKEFETVEVRDITGSLGRCSAFDAEFRPVCSCTRDRWESVYAAMASGKSLPPVELYGVGGRYFVLDGNHRVSVARSLGLEHLEALVTDLLPARED